MDRWSARRLHALAGPAAGRPWASTSTRRTTQPSVGGSSAARTYDALSLDPNNLPRYADFVAALDVLERFSLEETPR